MGAAGAFATTRPDAGLAARQESEQTPAGDAARAIPTVADKAAELLYDPERIFRFVADEVRYEAYPGALRGAKGALWGLAANSVDQALLLAALLNESLIETRFVIGELNESAATALLESARLDEAAALREPARAHLAAASTDVDAEAPGADLEADVERLISSYEAVTSLAQARLTDAVTMIGAALDSISLDLPEPPFALPDLERRRHVWLQYAAGPRWIDLDPSIPNAEPGATYATAADTVAELPVDLFHVVRFRVTVEEGAGEGVARREVLRQEVLSQDLVGTPIAFAHVKPDAYQAAGLAIVEAIEGTATLYPSLVIGSDVVVDQAIRVGSAGGALDVFGDSPTDGDALAEWLEFDVITPGSEPVTVSRTIFDRVGAARRAAGEVMAADVPVAELIDLEGVGPTYPPLLSLTLLSVTSAPVPPALGVQREFVDQDLLAHLSRLGLSYQLLLDGFATRLLAPRGVRLYPNAPNIFAVGIGVTGVEDGDPDFEIVADLVHRSFGFAPVGERSPEAPSGMLAGVVSHVAERALLDPSWVSDLGGTPLPTTDRSVGRVFEEAARQGIEILTIRPVTLFGRRRPEDLTPEAELLLDAALAAGLVVIVPERSVDLDGRPAIGWWLVDPATGVVRDQFETGQETTLVEYAERVAQWVYGPLPKFRTLGCAVAFIAIGAAALASVGASLSALDTAANPSSTAAGITASVLQALGGAGAFGGSLLGPIAGCR